MDITNTPRPGRNAPDRDGHSNEAAGESRSLNPTREFYAEISAQVEALNKSFYGGELPLPLITLDSKLKEFGHYIPRKVDHRTGTTRPGFSLHPALLKQADFRTLNLELMGLMEHLRQGKITRTNYHDRDYAAGMKERGIQVHREGAPDKETGERVTLSVIPGGRFDKFIAKRSEAGFAFSWAIRETESQKASDGDGAAAEGKESKSGRKYKYVCPAEGCDTAFWGKDGQKGGCLAHETPVALVQTD